MVIRNVVMGRLPADASPLARERLAQGLSGIAGLELPGRLDSAIGYDAGLRAGGWTFAITNDWVDAEAYRRYDLDPEHNRYRTMIVEVCSDVARVQFELP